MPTLSVTKHIDAPAQVVWALLADFGDVGWIPIAGDVRVEGEGPGMRRTISGSGDNAVIETLSWIKPEQRVLAYGITNNPFPPTSFQSVATVNDAGIEGHGATVTWEVDYEPVDDDDGARAGLGMIYTLMAEWLQAAAH
jgi:hypothetical protein